MMINKDAHDNSTHTCAQQRGSCQANTQRLMVGEKLCFLRNTVVMLRAGPRMLSTTVAFRGIYEKGKRPCILFMFILCLKITIFIVKKKQPVLLLILPSEQGMQSKQHTGFPFFLAMRVPGGQLSLHSERGGYREKNMFCFFLRYFSLQYCITHGVSEKSEITFFGSKFQKILSSSIVSSSPLKADLLNSPTF